MRKEEQDQTVKSEVKISVTGKQKKIKKIMKRICFTMHVPKLICIQNYFQIGDSCIINESSLKDPQNCSESILANTFFFKRIGSIQITESILQLNLKDIICPKLPINYFIDRYKSLGNKQFYNMSLTFQKLVKQFHYLSLKPIISAQSKPIISAQLCNKQFYQNFLYSYLETVKNKRFFCFYYEPSEFGLCLKKFIFSKNLLESVGLDIEQIRDDYIKHKHIFFEIFGGETYKEIVTKGIKQLGNLMEGNRLGKVTIEDALSNFAFNLKTFIHRKKNINGLIYEEEVAVQVKLYKPQVFLTIIELSGFDQSKVIRMYPHSKKHITVTPQENMQIQCQNGQINGN